MKIDLHKEASVQFSVAAPVLTTGWIIAAIVLIIAILGFFGVVPFGQMMVFGLLAALAVSRLI